MMNKWKRILAAAGTAALLVSNLGSVRQTAFATENPVDGVETQETGSTDNTNTSEQEEGSDANVLTFDASELIGNVLGTDPQPVADPEPEPSTEEPAVSDDEEPDEGQDDDETAEEPSEEPGEETQPTDPAAKSDQPADAPANPDETTVVPGEETSDETGDTTLEPTDEVPEEPTEDPDEESTDDEDEIALSDSIDVTLGTRESSKLDPAIDENGIYLYNLGETASTTVTIENPEGYEITEDDGAVIRVYMQFSDAIADETDAIPYKEEGQVNEDVAAANVADLISETAVASLSDTETTDAADDAEAAEETAADETTTAETKRAEQYNGSYGRTAKAGEHTVTTESGTTYQYTITELGDGTYCYEFSRPLNGEHYSVELTSSYAVDSIGGTNDIWAVVLSAEDRAELDGYELAEETTEDADAQDDDSDADDENTQDEADAEDEADDQDHHDGQVRVADRPEDDDLYQTLKWGSSASFVTKETTRTAETENYTVAVTYGPDSQIPAEATLSVTEYGPETEVYQRITEKTGETYDWLLDISFYYNELPLEPQAPIELKVTAREATEDASDKEPSDISTASLDDEDTDDKNDAPAETITTITHFADAGTEVIEDHEIDVTANDKGQIETSFTLDSLSLVAGQTYHSATVVNYQTAQNSNGDTFLIYKVDDGIVYFLVYNSGSVATLKMSLSDLLGNVDKSTIETSDVVDLGKVIYVQNSLKGTINGVSATVSWNQLCWQRAGGYALRSAANSNAYLAISSGSLFISWYIPYTVEFVVGSQARYSRLTRGTYDYGMGFDNGQFVAKSKASSATSLTVARVGSDYTKEAESVGGSTAVYTGDIDRGSLGFYTVKVVTQEGSETQSLQPIGGVTYTIYKRGSGTDENGRPNKGAVAAYVLTSDDSMHVEMPDLDNDNYIMEMTGVPDGYVCDDGYWTFTISNNQLVLDLKNESNKSEGVIVVNPDTDLEMNKTASVYDYDNRVYQVDLTAHSDLQQATFKPLNIHLVLDQSNSMLFPSGLKEVKNTGLKVTYIESKKTYAQIQNESNLDTNKVYYVITEPESSSTVWALWYDKGSQKWTYQDASYYALATYKHEFGKADPDYSHIRSSNTLAVFPYQDDYKGNTKSGNTYTEFVSGGRIVYETDWWGDATSNCSNVYGAFHTEVSSDNTTTTLTIYEAEDKYNRLHYLRQSVCEMLQMLSEMNPLTTVSLDGFYETPMECGGTRTLDNEGLKLLLDEITDITTSGGTRQDLALKKTYDDHLKNSTDKSSEYVILITDGAPAGANYKGSATDSVGDIDSDPSDSNTIYMRLNDVANDVKNKATLATVGLSMKNVTSGRKALAHISTDGPSVDNVSGTQGEWWFQPDSSSQLGKILCETILRKVMKQEVLSEKGTVVDYISDSFYPVDQSTNKAVASGTRIKADGTICKDDSGNAVIYRSSGSNPGTGTIWQDDASGSWYVQWDETDISGSTTTSQTKDVWELGDTQRHSWLSGERDSYTRDGKTYTWTTHENKTAYWYHNTETVNTTTKNEFKGTIYIKAKEDFIGGNAINTNGNQINTSIDEERGISSAGGAVLTLSSGGRYQYKRPTVNVRLLEMNNNYSLEIVEKGGTICSPQGDVNELLKQVVFTKIVGNDDGRVLNWRETTDNVSTMHDTQVGKNSFSLAYAGINLSDLTSDDWTELKNGEEVTVSYTYDDTEGAVGYFTFSLTKEGTTVKGVTQTPDWTDHTADVEKGRPEISETNHPYGDNWIERYTLNITYTAYKLGESGRPSKNQYNGDPGAGTKVDPAITTGVTKGQGKVNSTNIHYVYAYPTYELPDTGSMGTLPLELGGFAAMLGSMFVGYSRRRRHRKEGEM